MFARVTVAACASERCSQKKTLSLSAASTVESMLFDTCESDGNGRKMVVGRTHSKQCQPREFPLGLSSLVILTQKTSVSFMLICDVGLSALICLILPTYSCGRR
jgi:hypothetical protein